MPRGDQPTTTAAALKFGWVYEDDLPGDISQSAYDWFYKESLVLDGVRMGPPLTFDTGVRAERRRIRELIIGHDNSCSESSSGIEVEHLLDLIESAEGKTTRAA